MVATASCNSAFGVLLSDECLLNGNKPPLEASTVFVSTTYDNVYVLHMQPVISMLHASTVQVWLRQQFLLSM